MGSYKTIQERYDYEKRVLESILYFSRDDNKGMILPTIKEFIFTELINGILDYFRGDLTYSKQISFSHNFETELYSYVRNDMNKEQKLTPKIKKALLGMTKPKIIHVPAPAKDYVFSRLYHYYKEDICTNISNSSHYLSHDVISRVEHILPDSSAYDFEGIKYATPKLSVSELRDIKGIGKSMRQFINKDLEFIKNNYTW